MSKRFSPNDYTVAWICALPVEMVAAEALLDEVHENLPQPKTDHNHYTLGEMSGYRVVVASLPAGVYGTTSVATVATRILSSFSKIQFALLVGIGAGAPTEQVDVRLGDVVVGVPKTGGDCLLQYDWGKYDTSGLPVVKGTHSRPPRALCNALHSLEADTLIHGSQVQRMWSNTLKRYPRMKNQYGFPGSENDLLFDASYEHVEASSDCSSCCRDRLISRPSRSSDRPHVHYGRIASGSQIIKNGLLRDQLARKHKVLCFDMEAAGLMNSFPCLVIRGICDYADSHNSKRWQRYAAATAACFAKVVISHLSRGEMQGTTGDAVGGYTESQKNVWPDSTAAIASRLVKGIMTQLPEDKKEMTVVDALTNSSAHYKSILEIQQAEVVLESRAQQKGLESSWRESIVDLLRLLDLDSSIQTRYQLANLLGVHTGSPNSIVQNTSLHQAVLQELARNGGELPTNIRNQLANAKFPASEEASTSDESEVESVFSDNSVASSQSSSSQTANPALEIAYLLLKNETLSPLFKIAAANYDIRKLRKRLKSLISHYGRDLELEASSDIQTVTAKFVQGAARRVTIQLTRAMVSEIKNDYISNRRGINKLLESLPAHRQILYDLSQKSANHPQEPLSDSDSEQSEPESDLPLQTLQEVETFMVVSKAFITLVDELRKWLGVLNENIDEYTQYKLSEMREADDKNDTDRTGSPPVPATSQQQPEIPASEEIDANQTSFHLRKPSFLHQLILKLKMLEPMFWPKPPEGFKRITWTSPLGKPLYIDVRERVDGVAERLQERFRESDQKMTSVSSSSSEPSSTSKFVMTPRAPPAAHVIGNSSIQSAVSGSPNRGHDQLTRTVSATLPNNIPQMARKYLLLCFSTNKSEIFKKIDVTSFRKDQHLFDNLHLIYHAIKREESWCSKLPFFRSVKMPSWISWCLGDLHLYKPEKINFVSFKLMPLGEVPTPFNMRAPSLPPEQEVQMKNWHYSPCPIEVEEWAISKAFATKLLEPGHAFRSAQWLELFPKKLCSSVFYEDGNKTTLWGINIIDGLNKAAVAWLALLLMLSSTVLGLIYSLASHDVSAAFTLAAWFATSASLFITYCQLKI
ncbi:hypothetical protein BDV24DRAFT_157266 [Aspergillus arachidicola]|uniref:DUF3597 domain-containing protein n=1 Tax=Aspergillus arachidicola TaxID=656916 RepID=A0A5N6YTS8_9EURO|nr:hypothetical protein BDV24DRAFT_157266 [Aspergillus arachidicola]